ncbi:hypothetical protein HK098_004526 [Nowakowskiella sp. JEL0407]|nr:hypothetical protein HK098_004526 [Nowakowskiella sp. JEL0407]
MSLDHRDKSFTIDDFKALKAFQSADFSHPSLLDVLKTNPRIEYLSDKNAFTYRPNYKLNSKEDLLNLLRQTHLESCDGIDYSTLKDFPLLQPSVADLERENLILVIKDSKNLPKMLFYNDTSMNVSMSQEFQELWKSIVPPNEMELKRQLNAAGLRETQVEAKEVVKPPLKQVQSRKKRKTTKTGNRTNKHLEDFD